MSRETNEFNRSRKHLEMSPVRLAALAQGQALNMAAAPLLNGCNITLPLDMTGIGSANHLAPSARRG